MGRDDLFECLQLLVQQGVARGFGLSTDAACGARALAEARRKGRELAVLQYPYCPLTGDTGIIAPPAHTVFLNHVFGGRGTLTNATTLVDAIRGAPDVPTATLQKLASAEPAAVITDILINGALAATGAQCVVISMVSPQHIAENCRITGNSLFADQELTTLVAALARDREPSGTRLPGNDIE
jgi:aryl-alcohol dehydrogenase-like predicted oxidoreductase